jgi:hypothetical protein
MQLFSRNTLHHFKIIFPVPLEKYISDKLESRTASKNYRLWIRKKHRLFVSLSMASHKAQRTASSSTRPSSALAISTGTSVAIQLISIHLPRVPSHSIDLLHSHCGSIH